MPICAGVGSVGFVVAAGDGLMERWRDMGPSLWLATAVMVCISVAALLTIAVLALRDPRLVQVAPALLEPQGDETPAIVNLVTTDWDLGHEAIPGTLIDLAARRHLDIDMVGDDTFVSVRRRGLARPDDLTAYESMVLGHVSDLACRSEAGRVPAAALTTGPERSAQKRWKRFRAAVVDELALVRPVVAPLAGRPQDRLLVLAALPIALTAALAGSTLHDDPANDDDSPAESALWGGFWTFAVLGSVAWTRFGGARHPGGACVGGARASACAGNWPRTRCSPSSRPRRSRCGTGSWPTAPRSASPMASSRRCRSAPRANARRETPSAAAGGSCVPVTPPGCRPVTASTRGSPSSTACCCWPSGCRWRSCAPPPSRWSPTATATVASRARGAAAVWW